MLDIRWIRENPEALDRALKNRGAGAESAKKQVDDLIVRDEKRRAAIQKLQDIQTRRGSGSKEVAQAKAAKNEELAARLIAEFTELKNRADLAFEEERAASFAMREALAVIPNVPLDDVPVGPDEHANVEVRKWGDPRRVNSAKEHFELGEKLGQMDFETAAKLSGSRFVVLKKGLARMERALGQFMLDLHTEEHGYTEIQPPLLVNDDVVFGTGQLPKAAEDMFATMRQLTPDERREFVEKKMHDLSGRPSRIDLRTIVIDKSGEGRPSDGWVALFEELLAELPTRGRSWLIPTAEVSLTNLVREAILSEDELPLRFTALTPCFRSEAGSAGKDTRGMLRQHQFNKVELVSITTPANSLEEHERMTTCAEEVLKQLDLAYRVMVLSTGDMGFGAQKTYDLEVWLPGQKQFREISSCSVCGDFQARRMQARYRAKNQKQPQLVHTLNGSGVAVGRALIAVMETYQNEDGSITVPDVLRKYMGGLERIGA